MRYLIPLFSLLFLSACGPEIVYEKDVAFPATGWGSADSVRFDYTIENTDQAYNLMLTVDHGDVFPYQNFYVMLHTTLPSGKRVSEQLSLQLAGDFGNWLGSCSGEDCRHTIPILSNVRYENPGPYALTVEQYSRDEPLTNIDGLALRVEVRQ